MNTNVVMDVPAEVWDSWQDKFIEIDGQAGHLRIDSLYGVLTIMLWRVEKDENR